MKRPRDKTGIDEENEIKEMTGEIWNLFKKSKIKHLFLNPKSVMNVVKKLKETETHFVEKFNEDKGFVTTGDLRPDYLMVYVAGQCILKGWNDPNQFKSMLEAAKKFDKGQPRQLTVYSFAKPMRKFFQDYETLDSAVCHQQGDLALDEKVKNKLQEIQNEVWKVDDCPHKCAYCGRNFRTASTLRNHVRQAYPTSSKSNCARKIYKY